MARPTKHATLICAIMTVLAIIGIILGIVLLKPIIVVACLLPAVIYEVYRTEGESTKWASWVLLLVIILEIVLIAFNLNFDLGKFFGESTKVVAGYTVPLGDIKIFGPVIMAILSVLLFVRTRGKYTRWLAAIIFVTCFAIVYSLNPDVLKQLFKIGVEEGLKNLN